MRPTRHASVVLVAWILLVAPAAAIGSLATPHVPTVGSQDPSSASAPLAPASTTDSGAALAPATTTGALADEPLVEAPPADPFAVASTHPSVEYVLGYESEAPLELLAALQVEVLEIEPTLRFVLVRTHAPHVLHALDGILFRYVVSNGPTTLAASQWDASRWDASRWDASRWDASQWDSTAGESAEWDASQWDASRWDAAQWDASRWDASQWDASRWDASRWDGAPQMDPGFGTQWSLGAMHAPDAWTVTMGSHARTICSVDSGVDASHPDLARNIKRLADGSYGYDFVNGDKDPHDDGGHGTHTAGIAAAVTGNGHGIAGVSQSWILAAKVLDAEGTGTEVNLAKGIQWCADNGANIVILALHTDQDNQAVHDAVKYARGKGLLLLAASGNQGLRCDTCVAFPARYSEVMAVGASLPDSSVAGFSNGGKDLALVAPGAQIMGPVPGGYASGSGTSQAVANAAGAAALVWAAKPTLKADDVAKALRDYARDDGAPGFDHVYGKGHLRLDLTFRGLKLL